MLAEKLKSSDRGSEAKVWSLPPFLGIFHCLITGRIPWWPAWYHTDGPCLCWGVDVKILLRHTHVPGPNLHLRSAKRLCPVIQAKGRLLDGGFHRAIR